MEVKVVLRRGKPLEGYRDPWSPVYVNHDLSEYLRDYYYDLYSLMVFDLRELEIQASDDVAGRLREEIGNVRKSMSATGPYNAATVLFMAAMRAKINPARVILSFDGAHLQTLSMFHVSWAAGAVRMIRDIVIDDIVYIARGGHSWSYESAVRETASLLERFSDQLSEDAVAFVSALVGRLIYTRYKALDDIIITLQAAIDYEDFLRAAESVRDQDVKLLARLIVETDNVLRDGRRKLSDISYDINRALTPFQAPLMNNPRGKLKTLAGKILEFTSTLSDMYSTINWKVEEARRIHARLAEKDLQLA